MAHVPTGRSAGTFRGQKGPRYCVVLSSAKSEVLLVADKQAGASKPSQVERAYQEIKAKIVYGTYRPGAHLSEATLARVHGTSRTPIREALSRLSEERYVISDPGRGFVIAPVTLSTIRGTFEVRRLLEGAAAADAAELATPAEIDRMAELARYSYVVGDAASYRGALTRNLEFHAAVASGSHNELLVELVRQCLMQSDRVLSLGADFKPFEEGSSAEHMTLLDAIRKHNARRARAAMERHLDRASKLMMDAVLAGSIRGIVL